MNEMRLILDMLTQTFDGRAWHGPSFMDVLEGVDKTQASERLIEMRHTILEIVNHCSYWMEAVVRALRSGKMPDIVSTEDWPKTEETGEDWSNAQKRLKKAYEQLVSSVKDYNMSLLAQEIPGSFHGRSYTVTCRRMLHGISDHNTYHAGQIAILREKTA